MASLAELDESIWTARKTGCKDLVLLNCTSSYPASPENTNLRTIPHLKELFQCAVGLSDRTLGAGVAVASVGFGAAMIEKIFTLDRTGGGVGAAFSLEPQEIKILVEETKLAWQGLGAIHYGPTEKKVSLKFRRSIYVTEDLKAGDVLKKENMKNIRLGYGLVPKYYGKV